MSDQANPNDTPPAAASANASGEPPAGKGEDTPSNPTTEGDSAAGAPPTTPAQPNSTAPQGGATTLNSAKDYFPGGLKVDTGDGGSVVMTHGTDPVFDEVADTMFAQGLTAAQAGAVSASFVQAAHKYDPKPPTESEVSSDPMFGGNGPQHMAESKRNLDNLVAEGLMTQATLDGLIKSKAMNEPGMVLLFSKIGARMRPGAGPAPSAGVQVPPANRLTGREARNLYQIALTAAGKNPTKIKEANAEHMKVLEANGLTGA